MPGAYDEDLAHIHDAGFTTYARTATTAILDWLRLRGLDDGLVVDLGCGSGVTAAGLLDAGYDVLGVDISPAMVELARRNAPGATFVAGSAFTEPLPDGCTAVLAISEVINYRFDPDADLVPFFARVHDALKPGGLFVVDTQGPGVNGPEKVRRAWSAGEGWAVHVEVEEDRDAETLVRRITSFRHLEGDCFRRTHEDHHVRLYRPSFVARLLRDAGFGVRLLRSYAGDRFMPGHGVLLASKRRA